MKTYNEIVDNLENLENQEKELNTRVKALEDAPQGRTLFVHEIHFVSRNSSLGYTTDTFVRAINERQEPYADFAEFRTWLESILGTVENDSFSVSGTAYIDNNYCILTDIERINQQYLLKGKVLSNTVYTASINIDTQIGGMDIFKDIVH